MLNVIREVIFFILIFLLFYLATKSGHILNRRYPQFNTELLTAIVGVVFTLIIVAIFYLAKLNENIDGYKAFNLSPGAICKGPSYLFQGDDQTSKMCRQLASTADGRCQIAQYNCPNGYVGEPKNLKYWEYTSNSDSEWNGVQCKGNHVDKKYYERPHPPSCDCGLCSMWM